MVKELQKEGKNELREKLIMQTEAGQELPI